jgi:anti-sigma regulatory factor (Ser/Thr protein kinase)
MSSTHLDLTRDAGLERLAAALESFGVEHGIAPDLILELNLVIEELVTNTFNYGAPDGGDAADLQVWLEIGFDAGEVKLRLEDNGRGFDPLQKAPPALDVPLEERTVGGLGIHLVKTLMDDVAYSRQGDRNVIVMRKRVGTGGA